MMKYRQCAKINLGLKIVNKREDGYHNLKSVFIPVGIYDKLIFKRAKKNIIVKCKGIKQEDNLIYKTARLLKEERSVLRGVKIIVKKKIPFAAGLGGGSADAAATIKMLNEFWETGLNEEDMYEFASKIGSDVPFFIYNKTAVVEGRGEIVKPIDTKISFYVIIIKPSFGLETKKIYQNFSFKSGQENNIERVIQGVKEQNFDMISKNIVNDLESGVLYDANKYNCIVNMKKDLLESGAIASLMSGSGSCTFGIYPTKKAAKNAKKQLIKKKYKRHQIYIAEAGKGIFE
ncbi:MAG: 4-(cytidine 5'-diphospho)-2-C-methyl-D-erythritol kinase [Bacilli bacterium]|nr:4-(cytidine 5'-diphospho)-2-C-methyl-D-erythritol kinase [Bacilli bacterium]